MFFWHRIISWKSCNRGRKATILILSWGFPQSHLSFYCPPSAWFSGRSHHLLKLQHHLLRPSDCYPIHHLILTSSQGQRTEWAQYELPNMFCYCDLFSHNYYIFCTVSCNKDWANRAEPRPLFLGFLTLLSLSWARVSRLAPTWFLICMKIERNLENEPIKGLRWKRTLFDEGDRFDR